MSDEELVKEMQDCVDRLNSLIYKAHEKSIIVNLLKNGGIKIQERGGITFLYPDTWQLSAKRETDLIPKKVVYTGAY